MTRTAGPFLRAGRIIAPVLLAAVVEACVVRDFPDDAPLAPGPRELTCRPDGAGPFPAVVFNHGYFIDHYGYENRASGAYRLDEICRSLARSGYFAHIPIRRSGPGSLAAHAAEVDRAVDLVRENPAVDQRRIALAGFSRGALLALMVGLERQDDLRALALLAPTPGRGQLGVLAERVASLSLPILVMVEEDDDFFVHEVVDILESQLRRNRRDARIIRYKRGGGRRLFWCVGYYWNDFIGFLRANL